MRAVLFSESARDDLDTIWEYIAAENPRAADRLRDRVSSATQRLAGAPRCGHRRKDVRDPTVRFWPVRPYLIIFRFDDASITIVRIVHRARDIRRLLPDE